jgi:hypothetical protein
MGKQRVYHKVLGTFEANSEYGSDLVGSLAVDWQFTLKVPGTLWQTPSLQKGAEHLKGRLRVYKKVPSTSKADSESTKRCRAPWKGCFRCGTTAAGLVVGELAF